MRKKLFYFIVVLLALAITVWLTLYTPGSKAGAPGQGSASQSKIPNTGFDRHEYPIDQPGSLWWIVSKVRPLEPATYAPTDLVIPNMPLRLNAGDSEMRLRKEPAKALEQLATDAKQDHIDLMLARGYSSYQLQVAVYNANLQKYGQSGADKQSDRPGISEHQTGLAADLEPESRQCETEQCFGDLPEGQWLAANAYKYGFVLRYPLNKEAVTGYEYEPWHVRYVGADLSSELHKNSILTLEEFFDIVPPRQPY